MGRSRLPKEIEKLASTKIGKMAKMKSELSDAGIPVKNTWDFEKTVEMYKEHILGVGKNPHVSIDVDAVVHPKNPFPALNE